jgi:hypothetical protein
MWDYGKIMDNKLLLATKALGSRNAKIDNIQKVIDCRNWNWNWPWKTKNASS